ncbi:MAG: ral nucleoside transport system permease protein [Frankiales bacterium]|jgi:ABC-type uncharacterized transport system permease subunit|nr:ral nucleoside transport system permease protein [Frankiales bacterium]MDX6257069.1 ral nucleoside transport system permease protein [Frankiales bacterium]
MSLTSEPGAETETPVTRDDLTVEFDSPTMVEERPAVVTTGESLADRIRLTDWHRTGVTVGAYVAALAAFGILAAVKGANPFTVYHSMLNSTFADTGSIQQTFLRSIPIVLAALAVAVPARAGLVNVGGEGQIILGAVAATGVGVAIGSHVPGPLSWLAMGLAGAAAGAVWAGIAGVLRSTLNANESVTTLLLNFIANDIMLYLIYQPWKDPNGSGQPQSKPLDHHAILPKLFGSSLNLGLIIAAVVAIGVWYLLQRTGWGFALRVVGGNPEAARRAGLPVKPLLISSMVVGGALAGLGGALNLAGVETQLRPGTTITFGYIAFLASYLGRHNPAKVVVASVVFSAIALSGNGLQISNGLDGQIVNVLLGLIVLAPLILAKHGKRSA